MCLKTCRGSHGVSNNLKHTACAFLTVGDDRIWVAGMSLFVCFCIYWNEFVDSTKSDEWNVHTAVSGSDDLVILEMVDKE